MFLRVIARLILEQYGSVITQCSKEARVEDIFGLNKKHYYSVFPLKKLS